MTPNDVYNLCSPCAQDLTGRECAVLQLRGAVAELQGRGRETAKNTLKIQQQKATLQANVATTLTMNTKLSKLLQKVCQQFSFV